MKSFNMPLQQRHRKTARYYCIECSDSAKRLWVAVGGTELRRIALGFELYKQKEKGIFLSDACASRAHITLKRWS